MVDDRADCDLLRCEGDDLDSAIANRDKALAWLETPNPSLQGRSPIEAANTEEGFEQADEILTRIDTSRLKHIIAAHLSQQNNTPDKARGALARALNCAPDWIGIADQAEGFGWRQM